MTVLSAGRPVRVTDGLRRWLDRGEIPGIVTLVARHGEIVQIDALGWQDEDAKIPMRPDTIFRVASMSKPITAVAAMMLIEEGKLRLEDPVDRWLPELASPRVLRSPQGPLEDSFRSERTIKVMDLLTHRSGLIYLLDGTPLGSALGRSFKSLLGEDTPDEWMRNSAHCRWPTSRGRVGTTDTTWRCWEC